MGVSSMAQSYEKKKATIVPLNVTFDEVEKMIELSVKYIKELKNRIK